MENKEKGSFFSLNYFKKGEKIYLFILLFLSIVISSIIPVILSNNVIFTSSTKKDYVEKELSEEDFKSPLSFTFVDEEKTEELRKEEESKVVPHFSYSYLSSIKIRDNFESFCTSLINKDYTFSYLDAMDAEKLARICKKYLPLFTDTMLYEMRLYGREVLNHFLQKGVFSSEEITSVIQDGRDEIAIISENGDVVNNVNSIITDKNIYEELFVYIANNYSFLTTEEVDFISSVLLVLFKSNMYYDKIYTESLKEERRSSINNVVIEVEEGEYILREDKVVTKDNLKVLEELRRQKIDSFSFPTFVPRTILIVFLFLLWFWYIGHSIQYTYRKGQYTNILITLLFLSILGGYLFSLLMIKIKMINLVSCMPFFLVGLISKSLTGKKSSGFLTCLLLISLQSLWANGSIFSFFYLTSLSYVVMFTQSKKEGRISSVIIALKVMLYSLPITLGFSFIKGYAIDETIIALFSIIANVFTTFILYSIILPIFELIFNIPTKEKLSELSSSDSPVLSQLSLVAQGTYTHSKNVAELSRAASSAIGANTLLSVVGAEYHDIGKMTHPEYFIENQGQKNAHDEISSQLSVSIIKSHVRLGEEKAREMHLPPEVVDIISEHHGNDIIEFFYNEAKRNNEGRRDEALREDFSYDGEIPSSKESAIVMLSDSVEAATKSINNPNRKKYERMINNIVSRKLSFGLLDNSGLTMNEIKLIKESFVAPLMGRDHHRIKYEDEEE